MRFVLFTGISVRHLAHEVTQVKVTFSFCFESFEAGRLLPVLLSRFVVSRCSYNCPEMPYYYSHCLCASLSCHSAVIAYIVN